MINDIFERIHEDAFQLRYSLYADDVAVWSTNETVDGAQRQLQRALDRCQSWSEKWGLQICPEKSASIIFSRKPRTPNPSAPLTLSGADIPIVNSFKYLGMTLDSKLLFGDHISDIRNRCLKRLNILRCISGQKWGADRKTLLQLYTSLIRPILEYNGFLFNNISQTRAAALETVQNEALRIITGAFRTSPVVSLLAEVNIPSLAHRRMLQLARYSIRTNAEHNHPSLQILTNVPAIIDYNRNKFTIAKDLSDIREIALRLPNIPTTFIPKPIPFWTYRQIEVQYLLHKNKSNYSRFEIQEKFFDFKRKHLDRWYIYTDGSRTAEGAGGGLYCVGAARSFRLSKYHSIFSAELIAIREAFKLIRETSKTRVVICTDSFSAATALEASHNSSHPVINEIRHIYDNTSRNKKVKLLWIPGHSGITGNEKADEYAKRSLTLPEPPDMSCPAADILTHANTLFQKYLQRKWEIQNKYLHQIKPQLGYWHSSNQNNRHKERLLARLRIGHTRLTHQFIFDRIYGRTEPPRCQVCGSQYTIEHFLLTCPNHNANRLPMVNYLRQNNLPLSLNVVLGNQHPELLDCVFEFLHKTRLEQFI